MINLEMWVFAVIIPLAIVISTFLLLLRHKREPPKQETKSTDKEDTDTLESDSREDSEYEIGSGSCLFPPEPEPEDES